MLPTRLGLSLLFILGMTLLILDRGHPRHESVESDPAQERITLSTAIPAPSGDPWRDRANSIARLLPSKTTPPMRPGTNPIDAFLESWWSDHGIPKPGRCDDSTFLRRASLDIVGVLPGPEETRRFLKDSSPDKRLRLINRLLSDDLAYAEHGMSFWNDLLRNDEQKYLVVVRQPITAWLFQSLRENKAYDRMVAELLDPPVGGPEGYLKGVDFEFAGSVSDIPAMQAARASAQVFLGINLKCASCHNYFGHPWKLSEAWAYAAFFSGEQLQPYRCDKPSGEKVAPKYLFEGLGEIPPTADRPTRLRTVAGMTTSPRNPRFARVIVNRMFKKLIGQGLIDQVDDFDDRTAFHPDLLDWLAQDFIAHGYDLKHLIRRITTSDLYAMQTTDARPTMAEGNAEPLFVGPRVTKLSAEQVIDGIAQVTGYWPSVTTMAVTVLNPRIRAWRSQDPNALARVLGRPNRDVVVTERVEQASLLQALEFVNGPELSRSLSEGAKNLLKGPLGQSDDPAQVADTLTLSAYGRYASPTEQKLAREMLGNPTQSLETRLEGWEDYLWMLLMSDEFLLRR